MRENMKSKKGKTKFLFVAIISFTLLLLIFLALKNNAENLISKQKNEEETNITTTLVANKKDYLANAEQETNNFVYLSDIPYDSKNSSVGWGSITLDGNLETRV